MANFQRCHLAATGSVCLEKAYTWLYRFGPVVGCLGPAAFVASLFALDLLT